MQLDLLTQTIESFRRELSGRWSSGLEGLYDTVASWQAVWPPQHIEQLPAVLDQALTSTRTRAFWQGHAYFPKEALLELATFSPDMINLAFGRLFNLELDLSGRFSGFVFYLDEVLEEYRRAQPQKKLLTHYHEDYRAPSLYTAARYPDTHAYFEPDHYLAALKRLRAPQVGIVADASRFAKSVKVVQTFMSRNEAFAKTLATRHQPAHRNALSPVAYAEPSQLIVSEYFRWLSS